MAGQLRPLVALRWQMVREPSARAGLVVAAGFVPGSIVIAVVLGLTLPRPAGSEGLVLITPSVLLGFLALAIIAPLAAGGGALLYPEDQLVAFPVRPRTLYAGALLLAPLNLAWLLQVLVAVGLLTFVAPGGTGSRIATLATVLTYLGAVTLLGQALAWLVVGIRRTALGRWLTWLILACLTGAFIAVITTGRLTSLLDDSPTVWVVVGALAPGNGDLALWAARTVLLAMAAFGAGVLGVAACRWALQRPSDGGATREDRPIARRATPATATAMMRRIDRAGVVRAPALRRGALVLGLLPGGALLLAPTDWTVLTLLPGLIAAGAGLLFGVNAFCLDASGALWTASTPAASTTWFDARTATVATVIAIPVAIALAAGLVGAGAPPTWAAIASVFAGAVAGIARVTAQCMTWSVTRPVRADLRGPRDAPAPPGTMAVYALRLSLSTTVIGLVMSGLAFSGEVVLPLAAMTAYCLLAWRRVLRARTRYANPVERARIVAVVSGG